jgi:hypothetical protein
MSNSEIIKKAEAGMKESNKILVRELVADLEQRGISPAIAIDGEVCNLKICYEQLEIFNKIINDFGLKHQEFCLMAEERPAQSRGTEEENYSRYLVIVNKENSRIKEYSNQNWTAELILDIQKGFWQ